MKPNTEDGSYTYTEEVYEVQRKDKQGKWTSNLDSRVDGAPWFNAKTGQKLGGELDSVLLPKGWQWLSNWKYVRTSDTDIEGWSESDSFEEKYGYGSVVVKFPAIKNRPIRKRKWNRSREQQVQTNSTSYPATVGENPFFASASGVASGGANDRIDAATSDSAYTYPQLLQHIAASLRDLNEGNRKIESSMQYIGTSRDSQSLRLLLRSNISGLERDIERIYILLDRLEQQEGSYIASGKVRSVSSLKVARKKLRNDLESQKNRFKQLSKSAISKDKRIKPPVNSENLKTLPGEQTSSKIKATEAEAEEDLKILAQLKVQTEMEVNDAILKESEEAVMSINKELHEVKEVMQDLAMLVKDQDEGVGQIHANVEGAHAKTTEAYEELKKAEELQKKGGCCIS